MKITVIVRNSEEIKNKNITFENLFSVRFLVRIQLPPEGDHKLSSHIFLPLSFMNIFNEKNT